MQVAPGDETAQFTLTIRIVLTVGIESEHYLSLRGANAGLEGITILTDSGYVGKDAICASPCGVGTNYDLGPALQEATTWEVGPYTQGSLLNHAASSARPQAALSMTAALAAC